MENFKVRLKNHIEHVKNVREHCTTEETTKQALILPFLDILGKVRISRSFLPKLTR